MVYKNLLGRRPATLLLPALLLSALAWSGLAAAAEGTAYLGVQLQALDQNLMESFGIAENQRGVLISGVEKDSPADKAGIQRGDVITTVGSERVREPQEMQSAIGVLAPDAKVTLKFIRKGKAGKAEIVLGSRPDSVRERSAESDDADRSDRSDRSDRVERGPRKMIFMSSTPMMGVEVQEITPKLGHYFGTDEGLLVLRVHEDSPAAKAGLEEGDVIVEVDGKAMKDWNGLHDVLGKHEDGDKVKVTVMRDKHRMDKDVEVSARMGDDVEVSDLPNAQRFHGNDEPWANSLRDQLRGLRGLGRMRELSPDAHVYEFRSDSDQKDLHESLEKLQSQLDELRQQLEQLRKDKEK
jgi:predicted metalloprotease with PDZ domain